MNCPNCGFVNELDNAFCVGCGYTLTGGQGSSSDAALRSQETEVFRFGVTGSSLPHFRADSVSFPQTAPATKNRSLVWVAVGIVGILLVFGTYYFYSAGQPTAAAADPLPDHFGLFSQSKEQNRVDELKKYDFPSLVAARDEFAKSDAIPTLDGNPSLIIYSDGSPQLNDLRLIQLDSVNPDGSFKQIGFQAAPIEGKPEMRRMRIESGLANGKYAFATLEGFFNDGRHKLWPFRILNSSKADNNELLTSSSLQLKPVLPQQSFAPPPPVGSVARTVTTSVVLRSSPTQSSFKIRNLGFGEQVTVLEYSTNTESFKGRVSPFARVQTINGQQGWIFAAFLK